jgi:hypothetical protein
MKAFLFFYNEYLRCVYIILYKTSDIKKKKNLMLSHTYIIKCTWTSQKKGTFFFSPPILSDEKINVKMNEHLKVENFVNL